MQPNRSSDAPPSGGGSASPTVPSRGAPEAASRRRRRRGTARRALFALGAIATAEVIGTVGFHLIEGAGWIDAFYFESMLATGQGPPFTLNTDAGKIFASVMGFVSVGSTLSAVVFTLGPWFGRLWRTLVEDVEGRARLLEHELASSPRSSEEGHR
jgi:hypothetical protein